MKPDFDISAKRSSLTVTTDFKNELESQKQNRSDSIKSSLPPPPRYEEAMISDLETPEEKTERIRSHNTIHLIGLVICVGFSIVITNAYPYMKLLSNDPNLSKVKLGWVISATPIGQLLASPLMGFLANKIGSVRLLFIVSMLFFCAGSFIYALLPFVVGWWIDSTFHIMVFSRFLIGISSGCSSVCRSYVASSTTTKERTKVLTRYSSALSVGYIVGPVAQMVLNVSIEEDMMKYQSAGYASLAMGIICLIFLMPFYFKEHNIAVKERILLKQLNGNGKECLSKRDVPGLLGVILAFFLIQFVYMQLEAILEPFVQDQYGWCNDLAVVSVGFLLSGSAMVLLLVYATVSKLSKAVDERQILLFLGLGALGAGVFLMIPWAGQKVPYCYGESSLQLETSKPTIELDIRLLEPEKEDKYSVVQFHSLDLDYSISDSVFNSFCANVIHCLGCPPEQEWCQDAPRLPLTQLTIAIVAISIGFAYGTAMTNTLLSKMLGPKPQGTWMGFLTGAGSLARTIGPVYSSYIYEELGTAYAFGITLVFVFIGIVALIILHKRIVPMRAIEPQDPKV